jgi:hypothetical protein
MQFGFSSLLTMPNRNSFPSGEKERPYSNLSFNEINPGAKIFGISPGGVCPK